MAYTSHGHQIPGTLVESPRPEKVARCGAFAACKQCAQEAAAIRYTIQPLVVVKSNPRIIDTEPATNGTIRMTIESEMGRVSGVFVPDSGSPTLDKTLHTHEYNKGDYSTSISSAGLPHVHDVTSGRARTELFTPGRGLQQVAEHDHELHWGILLKQGHTFTGSPYWKD